MRDELDRKLPVALAGELGRVEPLALRRLAEAVIPESQLPFHERGPALARIMAEPAWSRGAVRMLDAPARAALRVLAHLPNGAYAEDLDALAKLLAPATEARGTPTEQLAASGAAWVASERGYGRLQQRARVLPSLRRRWSTLAAEPRPPGPPAPGDDEEAHVEHRIEFELGVALAAVHQARPRATRMRDMHRADEKALATLLAPLFGGEDRAVDALRALIRDELVRPRFGRLAVNDAMLATWTDPFTQVLASRLVTRRHWAGLLRGLALLVDEPGWIPRSEIAEAVAIAVLRSPHATQPARVTLDSLEAIRRTPGVLVRDHDGVEHWRASRALRDAFNDERTVDPRAESPLLVQPNLQVVAGPGTRTSTLAMLGRIARVTNADQVALFALEAESVRRAAIDGLTASEMLGFLESHASRGVPAVVARALSDWARSRGTARVAVGAIVVTDLPLDEVRRAAEGIELEVVAPGVYRADAADATRLLSALRDANIACTALGNTADEDDAWERRRDDEDARTTLRALRGELTREATNARRLPED